MSEDFFNIEKFLPATKFTNSSKYTVILSRIPIPPKRKYKDIMFVRPGAFVIIDREIEMTAFSIRFE